jgi:hypothetical protein
MSSDVTLPRIFGAGRQDRLREHITGLRRMQADPGGRGVIDSVVRVWGSMDVALPGTSSQFHPHRCAIFLE